MSSRDKLKSNDSDSAVGTMSDNSPIEELPKDDSSTNFKNQKVISASNNLDLVDTEFAMSNNSEARKVDETDIFPSSINKETELIGVVQGLTENNKVDAKDNNFSDVDVEILKDTEISHSISDSDFKTSLISFMTVESNSEHSNETFFSCENNFEPLINNSSNKTFSNTVNIDASENIIERNLDEVESIESVLIENEIIENYSTIKTNLDKSEANSDLSKNMANESILSLDNERTEYFSYNSTLPDYFEESFSTITDSGEKSKPSMLTDDTITLCSEENSIICLSDSTWDEDFNTKIEDKDIKNNTNRDLEPKIESLKLKLGNNIKNSNETKNQLIDSKIKESIKGLISSEYYEMNDKSYITVSSNDSDSDSVIEINEEDEISFTDTQESSEESSSQVLSASMNFSISPSREIAKEEGKSTTNDQSKSPSSISVITTKTKDDKSDISIAEDTENSAKKSKRFKKNKNNSLNITSPGKNNTTDKGIITSQTSAGDKSKGNIATPLTDSKKIVLPSSSIDKNASVLSKSPKSINGENEINNSSSIQNGLENINDANIILNKNLGDKESNISGIKVNELSAAKNCAKIESNLDSTTKKSVKNANNLEVLEKCVKIVSNSDVTTEKSFKNAHNEASLEKSDNIASNLETSGENKADIENYSEELQSQIKTNWHPRNNLGIELNTSEISTNQSKNEPECIGNHIEDGSDSDSSIEYNLSNERVDAVPHSDFRLPDTVTYLTTDAGDHVYLIGTAHFSTESQNDVINTIKAVKPDVVMLELCQSRVSVLKLDEEKILEQSKNLDFAKIKAAISEQGAVQGVLYILLLSVSVHITKQLGMAPGGEFRAALAECSRSVPNCVIQLGDRPINITLRRAFSMLNFWQKLKFFWKILLSKEPISKEEIEKCKNKDFIEEMLAEMTGEFPIISQVFVKERDLYLAYSLRMAADSLRNPDSCKIRRIGPRKSPIVVVGVVGIGHTKGMVEHWQKVTNADVKKVIFVPPPSFTSRICKKGLKVSLYALVGYGIYKCVPNTIKESVFCSINKGFNFVAEKIKY